MSRSPLDALARHARIAALTLAAGSTACAPPLQARSRAGIGEGMTAPLMREHVIQPGETMWRIARRYGLTVDDLARHNGIDDPTRVRAGRVLEVPAPEPEAPPAGDTPAAETGHPPAKTSTGLGTPRPAASGDSGGGSPRRAASAAAPSSTRSGYRLRWPVEGSIVARFGTRAGSPHDGIDIAVAAGTAVRAAAAGKVVFSGRHGGYGNLVIVRHGDGLVTVYAHNSVNLVRKGQHVAAGEILGRVGTASRTGSAQLHFEVREGVEARNPLKYLPP